MSTSSSTASPIGLLSPDQEDIVIQRRTCTKMYSRVCNSIVAMIIPTVEWPWWAMAIQASFVSILMAFASMNSAIRWLGYGIGFDLLTGIACTFLPNHPSALSKQAGMTFARGMGLYLAVLLGRESALQFEIMGYPTSGGEMFAIYFLTGIWASAAKNMGYLGVPWPKWALELLEKVHSSIDKADISDKIISIFKSSSMQSGGGTEIISKSETTVTTTPPNPTI